MIERNRDSEPNRGIIDDPCDLRVVFARGQSHTRNHPASKYSRCRIGPPNVLREIPPQYREPLTTTQRACERESPQNPIGCRSGPDS